MSLSSSSTLCFLAFLRNNIPLTIDTTVSRMKAIEMGRVKKISGDPLDITSDCMKEVSISLAKHRGQDHGGDRKIELAHEVADHPEEQADPQIKEGVAQAVGADQREDGDHRPEDGEGNERQARPETDQWQVQDQQHYVADVHAGDDRPQQARAAPA